MLNHISAIKNKGKGVTVEGEDKLERRGEEGKDKQPCQCREETENNINREKSC